MRVATPSEMREMDRMTIEDRGVPGMRLMEAAGEGAATVVQDRLSADGRKRVVVVCGKGNNGGDGFVVARHLRRWGAQVRVFSLARPEALSGDAAAAHAQMVSEGEEPAYIGELTHFDDLATVFGDADVIVDAILGTGFQGEVRSPLSELIIRMNEADPPVIALDIPSGVNGATGEVSGVAVNADLTTTFALPKLGLVLQPGRSHAGEIRVIDIGIPEEVVGSVGVSGEVILGAELRARLPRRGQDAHKGDCGRVLVVGGSVGLTGAVALAGMAAARSGAGLVTVAVPESLNDILEVKLTEVMTVPLAETPGRAIGSGALDTVRAHAEGADAVVLGPGLSRDPHALALSRTLGQTLPGPVLIDADGLNAFAGTVESLREAPGPRILTPHPGEAARLLGCTTTDIRADALGSARRLAESSGAVVVLKGAPSVIAEGTGPIGVNTTGNAGLATGGTGDVLSGLIGGLLAQGASALDAATVGVYLHGLAGDLGADRLTVWGLVAGDVVDLLPEAFYLLDSGEDENAWIR